MAGRPSVKHARPVVLDIVNNGIGKSHARIVNNIAHGTRAGNVLCYRNISCKGSCDDQDRLPYLMDPHGITPTVRALLVGADPNRYARDASQDHRAASRADMGIVERRLGRGDGTPTRPLTNSADDKALLEKKDKSPVHLQLKSLYQHQPHSLSRNPNPR